MQRKEFENRHKADAAAASGYITKIEASLCLLARSLLLFIYLFFLLSQQFSLYFLTYVRLIAQKKPFLLPFFLKHIKIYIFFLLSLSCKLVFPHYKYMYI